MSAEVNANNAVPYVTRELRQKTGLTVTAGLDEREIACTLSAVTVFFYCPEICNLRRNYRISATTIRTGRCLGKRRIPALRLTHYKKLGNTMILSATHLCGCKWCITRYLRNAKRRRIRQRN